MGSIGKPALSAFVLLACVLSLSCQMKGPSLYQKSRALMDTYVTITVVSDSSEEAEKATNEAFLQIEQFGALINFYAEDSEISGINRNAGTAEVSVSPLTFDVISQALEVAEKSGGAFDPTVGPIVRLWDFLEKKRPSEREIRDALPLVGHKNVRLNRDASSVFLLKKGMQIDLGGIAKGYAADLAVESLKKNGMSAGLVAIAGDIRGYGTKPDGSAWRVGVQNPRQTGKDDEIVAKTGLLNRAVSTSGDYQRYFETDGTRYHHLIDPKTGYPARGCRSVSVIAGKGVLADAFSTAVFILGPAEGMKLIESEGLGAVIIDGDGKFHVSTGLRGKVEIETGT